MTEDESAAAAAERSSAAAHDLLPARVWEVVDRADLAAEEVGAFVGGGLCGG
jgi:hypothetical protein